jgi:branched-chain amino acid transport system substrate-binding protein
LAIGCGLPNQTNRGDMMIKRVLTRAFLALGTALVISPHLSAQNTKPAELKIGITTFLTGSASVFGVPAKDAAELWIEEFNRAGGINGVKLAPVFLDEGMGGSKLISEYRRVAQEPGDKVMLAALSSANCLALAPVAEDLKVINIMWNCGTERALEERRYKYVFRTTSHAGTALSAAAVHLLREMPNIKTLAVINQDYAWGRDSWDVFRATLLALKPDVKIVAELFPKFGAPSFATEITRLQVLKPDVILSTFFGGDLDTFMREASGRGLHRTSKIVLPLGESSLERLGKTMPDGVLVGIDSDAYFADPEFKDDPKMKGFVQKFRAKTGNYPIYPAMQMVQALEALTQAYDKAIKGKGGQWPDAAQVADSLHGLEFRAVSRPIKIREDGQAMQHQLYGVTKHTPQYPFAIIDKLVLVPADLVTAPVGQKSVDWMKTLKADVLKNPQIKNIRAAGK